MKHGHRFLIGALVTAVLAVTLALLAAGGQGAQATDDIIYVDADATVGANNGTSWPDAFLDLQLALDVAGPDDRIWVAEGTYKPTAQHGGTGDRYRSFQMVNGVAIYGGFDPTLDDIGWDDRDWENNLTILSGDIGLPGDTSDNGYHVVHHPFGTHLDNTAVLDGFTITGGNANGAVPYNYGGGMYNEGVSPTLSNVTFVDNWAASRGGGMYNGSESLPMLSDCTFTENSAAYSGGGMYNERASPTLTDCTFSGNFVEFYGGGMYNYDSSPTLTNCTFVGNLAEQGGGGMINFESTVKLTDCTFGANLAALGGGILNDDSSLELTNCAFFGNTALLSGGGMYNTRSSLGLLDCTFMDNSAEDGHGGGMSNDTGSSLELANCAFSRNSAENGYGAGMHNSGTSLMLTNCTFWGNGAALQGGGMSNDASSPTVTNCILWGDFPDEIYNSAGSSPVVTYSDIQGGYPGTGNITDDPLLTSAYYGDFHLSTGSPCVDRGNNLVPNLPDHDFEGDARVIDGDADGMATVDMGVDEVPIRVYLPLVLRNY